MKKSEVFPPAESPENREKIRLANAERWLNDFLALKPEDKVLFLSDSNPLNTDRQLIGLLKRALDQKGNQHTEIIAGADTTTEQIAELLAEHQVIWASCNWENTGIDFYVLTEQLLPETGARMEDAVGLEVGAFDQAGFLSEGRADLEKRMGKMLEHLQGIVGIHASSVYGTDLWLKFRPDRRWVSVSGAVDPGEWDNPGAEVFTTPDETTINGRLVLPVLQDEISKAQGVDKFVYLTLRNGKIAKIDGGESAEELRSYLQKHSVDETDPASVIQCSEIAFGASEFARGKAKSPGEKYSHPGVSVLEAEKRLGTIHIAFGSGQHGIEGVAGVTESDVHVDFVLPRNGLTVRGYYSEADFEKKTNSRLIIDEGRLRLLD